VRQLLNSIRNANGTLAFGDPNTPGTQAFQIVNGGRVGLNTATWRPYRLRRRPVSDSTSRRTSRSPSRLTAESPGPAEFAGFKLNAKAALTFNGIDYKLSFNDMLVDRLQAALNGLGGPAARAQTPGANGCQYYNPFSSAIVEQRADRGGQPRLRPGLANEPATWLRWLYVPLRCTGAASTRSTTSCSAARPRQVLRPTTRPDRRSAPSTATTARRWTSSDLATGDESLRHGRAPDGLRHAHGPAGVRPRLGRRPASPPTRTALPDRLDASSRSTRRLQPADGQRLGRYEKFYSDVSPTDNHVFVPADLGKWQAHDWFGVRGTAASRSAR
jgi:hypothetical protein